MSSPIIFLSCPPGSAYNPVSTEAPTPTLSYNCSSGVSLLRGNLFLLTYWSLGMTLSENATITTDLVIYNGPHTPPSPLQKPVTRVTDPCDQPGLKTQGHRLLHPRMYFPSRRLRLRVALVRSPKRPLSAVELPPEPAFQPTLCHPNVHLQQQWHPRKQPSLLLTLLPERRGELAAAGPFRRAVIVYAPHHLPPLHHPTRHILPSRRRLGDQEPDLRPSLPKPHTLSATSLSLVDSGGGGGRRLGLLWQKFASDDLGTAFEWGAVGMKFRGLRQGRN
ncbi:hypothetical protein BGW80DRAFT_1565972 [Lactifluus volemus]|nr:hypothetical protein BGW80DRAFT_1565972 [Lactifluus volemus]